MLTWGRAAASLRPVYPYPRPALLKASATVLPVYVRVVHLNPARLWCHNWGRGQLYRNRLPQPLPPGPGASPSPRCSAWPGPFSFWRPAEIQGPKPSGCSPHLVRLDRPAPHLHRRFSPRSISARREAGYGSVATQKRCLRTGRPPAGVPRPPGRAPYASRRVQHILQTACF